MAAAEGGEEKRREKEKTRGVGEDGEEKRRKAGGKFIDHVVGRFLLEFQSYTMVT